MNKMHLVAFVAGMLGILALSQSVSACSGYYCDPYYYPYYDYYSYYYPSYVYYGYQYGPMYYPIYPTTYVDPSSYCAGSSCTGYFNYAYIPQYVPQYVDCHTSYCYQTGGTHSRGGYYNWQNCYNGDC